MIYRRQFRLQAAHFNSLGSYLDVWATIGRRETTTLSLLKDIHGHNFKIIVEIRGMMKHDGAWLVDDVALEEIVMSWNNCNLSVHDDFLVNRLRATTENMAHVLMDKLAASKPILDANATVRGVRVYETDDIFAQVGDVSC